MVVGQRAVLRSTPSSVTEDELRRAYATAFIAQARSDWEMHRWIESRADVATCHKLHYLQMTCEKVAKAYRLRDTKSPVRELISRHTGFSKFITIFCRQALAEKYQGKSAQLTRVSKDSQTLAREIEKLAPAIDRTVAPENVEYPWERHDQVIAPCHYGFPSLDLLQQAGGRTFLKLVKQALDGFTV